VYEAVWRPTSISRFRRESVCSDQPATRSRSVMAREMEMIMSMRAFVHSEAAKEELKCGRR
jgi:hypothetical protein